MQNKSLFARILPHPFVSVIVAMSWLMLNHSAESFDFVVAISLGLIIPKLIQPFIIHTPNIHWKSAIQLFFVVLWDIVISNIKVAKQVLGPTKNLTPKWFRVPLETDHEHVNTLLAMIITTTPGTENPGRGKKEALDITILVLRLTSKPEYLRSSGNIATTI
jgi:multicomponent K+:H+ antiporter subunit E